MNNRWIDQYLLRYAVGSILGSVIVVILLGIMRRAFPHLQIPTLDSWGKMTALGAAGLAFCYVASAPLLVFHVARWFFLSSREESKHFGLHSTAVITLACPLMLHCVLGLDWFQSMAYAALFAIFYVQMVAWFLLQTERKNTYAFYRNLAVARTREKTDIVESYRGIREHGNAYAIVLLEVLLGLILAVLLDQPWAHAKVEDIYCILLALAGIWVCPAALMLYAAARIETDFVDAIPTAQPPSTSEVAQVRVALTGSLTVEKTGDFN